VSVSQYEDTQVVLQFLMRWHSGKLSLQTVPRHAFPLRVSGRALICATADVT
jgi:hypothetical protein